MSNALSAINKPSDGKHKELKQVKLQTPESKRDNEEEISRIIFDENENLPPTEITIVRNIFYVRHRGTLIQIPAEQVPCLSYDEEENRVNIICEKAPDDVKEQGISVKDERDAEILTHMLIRAVQEYHRRLTRKRNKGGNTQNNNATQKVRQTPQKSNDNDAPPKVQEASNSHMKLWIAGGVGVFVILMGLMVFILKGQGNQSMHQNVGQTMKNVSPEMAQPQPWRP